MKTKTLESLPSSHLAALHDAGFTVISYLNKSVLVRIEDFTRTEWLPRLCVAQGNDPNSYRLIEWLPRGHPANAYSFDGWQSVSGHSYGGMYETIGQALAWFDWHEKARTGWGKQ